MDPVRRLRWTIENMLLYNGGGGVGALNSHCETGSQQFEQVKVDTIIHMVPNSVTHKRRKIWFSHSTVILKAS